MPPSASLPWTLRWRRRLRSIGWTLALAALLAALWWTNRPPLTAGRMLFASDGDSFTLSIDGTRTSVRLLGIDAPELAQNCETAGGAAWRCGVGARDALTGAAPRGAAVTCRGVGKDRFDRALSRCTLADGRDLAALLIEGGWAIATTEDYLIEEDRARARRAGIWQGDHITPAEWRAANPRR
jgi:endonuclease YncB( thermonuclease family)